MTDESEDPREGRIRKLEGILRKAEGASTEEERDAFMAGASRLMEQWNIDAAELRLAGGGREAVVTKEITYSDSDANLPGKRQLMSLACEIVGAVRFAYASGQRHAQTGWLVGFQDNIDAAEMLYASLFLQAKSGAWREGYTSKKQMTSYMVGFSGGAYGKLDAWRRAQQQTVSSSVALVLVDRQSEVDQVMEAMAGKPQATDYDGDPEAAWAGEAAGRDADLGQARLS